MDTDPVTGRKWPDEAYHRVLYTTPKVHIYRIPPITSTRGFNAATWTQNPKDNIFDARLRIIETAIPPPRSSSPETPENVLVNILLEDPKSGQLFAAAPYTSPQVVEQALDSSRFFAIRVVGEGGMKATLGLGYEERPEAFDFGVCLQDARRVLGYDGAQSAPRKGGPPGRPGAAPKPAATEVKRDFSLKEGETITVNIGGKSRIGKASGEDGSAGGTGGGLFAIPPPPGKGGDVPSSSGGMPFLPPPPSVKSGTLAKSQPSAADLGFDDGEFGEFQ